MKAARRNRGRVRRDDLARAGTVHAVRPEQRDSGGGLLDDSGDVMYRCGFEDGRIEGRIEAFREAAELIDRSLAESQTEKGFTPEVEAKWAAYLADPDGSER